MKAAYFAVSLAIAVSRKNTGIGVIIIKSVGSDLNRKVSFYANKVPLYIMTF
jgi:hypothetical protein